MRDPLNVLSTVRQRSVDQRRQALAGCLMREAEVAARIAALDQAIRQNDAAADTFPDHRHFRDIFIAARQHLAGVRQHAAAARADAEARSEDARQALAAARLDAEVVERLISERTVAAGIEADHRAQHELDDLARASRRLRGITRNCRP